MKCPKCSGPTSVYDTRDFGDILRRRECRDCKHRFATKEILRSELQSLEKRANANIHVEKALIKKAIKSLQEIVK